MPAETDIKTGSNAPEWQRVSPLSIIDYVITLVRQGLIQAIPALAVLVASAASSERLELVAVLGAVIAAMLLTVVYGVLAYLRFGYQFTENRINVRKGVLHREVLNIDKDRIQNVTIHEPFYFRPFQIAALGIDTAGSSGKEIRLPGISLEKARQLRDELVDEEELQASTPVRLHRPPGHEASEEPSASVLRSRQVLLRLTRRDVIIAGLTANFMLWAAIALGTFFGAGDVSERALDWLINTFQIKETVQAARAEGGDLLAGLMILAAMSALMLLLPLLSVIGAVFRYDGYELSVNGDRFRRTSGLIGRHDESVRQHKIQAVTWKQNAVGRLLGRINLQLRQASAGSGIESGDMSGGALKQTFPVPALMPAKAESLTARFLPGYQADSAAFTRVDLRRYMTVSPLLILTPLGIALALPGYFVDWRWAAVWFPVAMSVLLIHLQCWRQTGWAVVGEHAHLRTGFIGSTTNIFPLFKIQRVDVTQTAGMRRRGLAHCTIHLASHSTTLPWMAAEDAFQLRDLAVFKAETSHEAWF